MGKKQLSKKISNISLVVLLLCNILFTQVVANYFHTHHTDGENNKSIAITHIEQGEATQIDFLHSKSLFKSSKETCKICSLDLFHQLFFNEIKSLQLIQEPIWGISSFCYLVNHFSQKALYIIGRAPPAIF